VIKALAFLDHTFTFFYVQHFGFAQNGLELFRRNAVRHEKFAVHFFLLLIKVNGRLPFVQNLANLDEIDKGKGGRPHYCGVSNWTLRQIVNYGGDRTSHTERSELQHIGSCETNQGTDGTKVHNHRTPVALPPFP